MSKPPKPRATARCACGSVVLEVTGTPITSAVCHCDDCEEGSRQIEALPNAPPVRAPDGGTAYVLYRKDRFERARGEHLLRGYKIREKSSTSRVVATCCNAAMFLDVERGHWVSVYRARLQGDVPPLQMRIWAKRKPENDDVPSYPTYPLRFLAKLLAAKAAMLLHR